MSTRYVYLDLVLRVVGEEQTTKVRAYVDPRGGGDRDRRARPPGARGRGHGLRLLGLDGDAWEAEAKILDAEYEAGTRTRGDRPGAADESAARARG